MLVETLIRERQQEYYNILGVCDNIADSGLFVEFMLITIHDALNEIAKTEQVTEQVKKLLECMGENEYSTKELMERLQLKHRPTFRVNYLLPALELGLIEMTVPEKPNSSKQRYRKIIK